MIKHHVRDIDHESCVAYYRDALPFDWATEVRAYLDTHPETARLAQADAEYEEAIAAPLDHVLDEAIPSRLRVHGRSTPRLWANRLAVAAVIIVSLAVGWWFGQMPMAVSGKAAFAERVVAAVQQPSVKPIPVDLRQDVGTPPPPDMSLQGFQLVSQRRLGNGQSPLVEFVYRDAGGHLLRIYAETDTGLQTTPTISSRNGVALAQWRDGNTRYALVGELPDTSLQTLARAAQTGTGNGANQLAGAKPLTATQTGNGGGAMIVHPSLPLNGKIAPAPVAPVAPTDDSYPTQPTSM